MQGKGRLGKISVTYPFNLGKEGKDEETISVIPGSCKRQEIERKSEGELTSRTYRLELREETRERKRT